MVHGVLIMIREPYAFQATTVDWLKDHPKAILAHEQGLGKTICAVMSCDAGERTCVVSPRFLMYMWYDTFRDWRPDLNVSIPVNGVFPKGGDVIIITYHELSKYRRKWRNWNLVKVIFDEGHFLKGVTTQRSIAGVALMRRCEKVIYSTGTPVPSRPIELYPALFGMGITRRSYTSYARKYCAAWDAPWGFDVSGASRLPELRELIAPHMIRFTKTQVLPQLPSKQYSVISFSARIPIQEKEYSIDQFAHVDPEIAFERLSMVMRLHAMIKLPYAIEYIETLLYHERKLIVFAHHRESMLDPLIEFFADYSPAIIIGGMKPQDIRASELRFQDDPECRLIFVSVSSGMGLTLTAANRVVMVESSWVPSVIDQCADRAHRISQTRNVQIDILTIRNSIDQYQIRRALEKIPVINNLVRKTKMATKKSNPMDEIADAIGSASALIETLKKLRTGLIDLGGDSAKEEEEEKPKRTRRAARAEPEEEEEKPKRTRRAAGAEPDEEEEEEEEEVVKPKRTRKSSGDEVTLSQVRSRSYAILNDKKKGRAHLLKLLDKYGASKVSELDPADYANFIGEK